MAASTLYASADQKRFFYVPDDAVLGPGDCTVRSLTGKRLAADPAALDAYEVPVDQAQAITRQMMEQLGGKVRAVLSATTKALAGAAAGGGEAGASDAGAPGKSETLEDLGAQFKGALQGLVQAAQESKSSPVTVQERMKGISAALREHGMDPEAAEAVERFPERLRALLTSEETLAKLDAVTEDLRKAAAELRAERVGEA